MKEKALTSKTYYENEQTALSVVNLDKNNILSMYFVSLQDGASNRLVPIPTLFTRIYVKGWENPTYATHQKQTKKFILWRL